jgi:hypothetical protein
MLMSMALSYRASILVVGLALVLPRLALAQSAPPVPVPRPFPGAGSGSTSTPPAGRPPEPAAPPDAAAEPAPPSLTVPTPQPPVLPTSVPVYPSAEFLETFDAGAGQRFYLFGTNLPYADIVTYYRSVLKTGGRELYKSPGMHQFDLGKFQDDTMAYPPSIVVKDYESDNSPGYLFVSGTTEKRFRTIIQIVPPGPGR